MLRLVACPYCATVVSLDTLENNYNNGHNAKTVYFSNGKMMWVCKVCSTRNVVDECIVSHH